VCENNQSKPVITFPSPPRPIISVITHAGPSDQSPNCSHKYPFNYLQSFFSQLGMFLYTAESDVMILKKYYRPKVGVFLVKILLILQKIGS
jgi:hypothetical protein